MCKIGKIAVPFRISKNLIVQSWLQIKTYLAHKQKLTTGEPMYISHTGLFDIKPITLHIGPAGVIIELF